MDAMIVAPCGVICNLCLGFQRTANRCAGCNEMGDKTQHCNVCSIKRCPEKQGNPRLLCSACTKFPCRRIRDLEKRYTTRYGESPIGNLQAIEKFGMETFSREQAEVWRCGTCGELLCVHRENCLHCGAPRRR